MKTAIDAALIALLLFQLALLARIIFSWVFAFSRDWRPDGAAAVAIDSVYAVTDPVIKPLRRIFPAFTVGQMRFDVAILLAFGAVWLLQTLLVSLRNAA